MQPAYPITQASMRALIVLLEGRDDAARNSSIYHAHVGFDPMLVQAACQTTTSLEQDTIVAIFDPADVTGGPVQIGVAIDLGDTIRLQFGRLWVARGAKRAVIVPRGVGRRFGYYACKAGRFVSRSGWPADDLTRGTERAEARLAELTIEFALAPD